MEDVELFVVQLVVLRGAQRARHRQAAVHVQLHPVRQPLRSELHVRISTACTFGFTSCSRHMNAVFRHEVETVQLAAAQKSELALGCVYNVQGLFVGAWHTVAP